MRGFLTDIAGTIISAAVIAVGAALWDTAFAPLLALSPWRFVLTCVMAALIGAGIACSITLAISRGIAEGAICGKEADEARHKALKKSAEAYYERLESLRSVVREAGALEAVSIARGAPDPDGPTGDTFIMAAMFGRDNAMGFALAFDRFAGDETGYARWRGMALASNIRNYLKDVAEEIDCRKISDYQFASAALPAARSLRRKLEKLDALTVSEINAPRPEPHREHGVGRKLWFKWYQRWFRRLRSRTVRLLDRAGLSPCPDLVPGSEV